MFNFFANLFGYLLNFIYNLVTNYGVAIIMFSLIIKIILLPLSISQQKSMKKNAKIQGRMKIIQAKYKNDPEKMNQEVISLYKEEKINPFGGCVTAIVQMILLLSIFYLVRAPLTYMEKMSEESINTYSEQLISEEMMEENSMYGELDLIKNYEWLKEQNPEDEDVDRLALQMNFLGVDLNKIPKQNLTDITVYIIPVLYIISSFISIKLTTNMQKEMKESNTQPLLDAKTGLSEKKEEEEDPMVATNKMMMWMLPIMSISIAAVAPLGLALYWLVNNVLMIIERIIMNKCIKSEGE